MKNYRQRIEVPERVTATLFGLPIVSAIHKSELYGLTVQLYWGVRDYTERVCMCAFPGQWLCEDEQGRWWIEEGCHDRD